MSKLLPGREDSVAESKGRSRHGAGCTCLRCRGFQAGNEVALRHGAYVGVVHLAPRAREIADVIVAELQVEGLWRPLFAPAVAAASVTLVRQERAEAALQAAENALVETGAVAVDAYLGPDGTNPLGRLREDSRRWANAARGYLNDLGLTPRALAAIARDTGIGRATRASAALDALAAHVDREHGEADA